MPSKDKRKKILKRLSKLKKLERKEKKKKRTKYKGSKSNNLYQEYVYKKKNNRTKTYLLVLFILLLVAIGIIVYFFVIKPKLDNKTEAKPKCTKNENEDCQKNEYLYKEKCECLPCENPNPTCKTDEYYDPNNLPYCRNSNEYITDKDGNKKKMYSCQPCPTCPDEKPVNNCPKSDRTFDINNKDSNEACYRPSFDNNIDSKKGLSGGAIAAIVIGIVLFLGLGVFIFIKFKEKTREKAVQRKRKIEAATKIQTLWRGKKNRNDGSNMRGLFELNKETEQKYEQVNSKYPEAQRGREAATKIQAMIRGKKIIQEAKDELARLKADKKAKNNAKKAKEEAAKKGRNKLIDNYIPNEIKRVRQQANNMKRNPFKTQSSFGNDPYSTSSKSSNTTSVSENNNNPGLFGLRWGIF